MANTASLLTIGTELTDGEIVNSNAAWLSERLTELGIEIRMHLVVPDERELILEGLRICAAHSRRIFVTGGLGPTSDDITRDVVAEFLGDRLVFNEKLFGEFEALFRSLGRRVFAGHRHQFEFPSRSEILPNSAGTAQGFIVAKDGLELWVSPGPPRELRAVFEEQMWPRLRALAPPRTSELKTWKCLGKGESEFAEDVERVLAGSGYRIGYRASVPYVIVKVWVPVALSEEDQKRLKELEDVLGPWTVVRGKDDLAVLFLKALGTERVALRDMATRGFLVQRLLRALEEEANLRPAISFMTAINLDSPPADMVQTPNRFELNRKDDRCWEITARWQGRDLRKEIAPPYKFPTQGDRPRRFLTEWALKEWLDFLNS